MQITWSEAKGYLHSLEQRAGANPRSELGTLKTTPPLTPSRLMARSSHYENGKSYCLHSCCHSLESPCARSERAAAGGRRRLAGFFPDHVSLPAMDGRNGGWTAGLNLGQFESLGD